MSGPPVSSFHLFVSLSARHTAQHTAHHNTFFLALIKPRHNKEVEDWNLTVRGQIRVESSAVVAVAVAVEVAEMR